MIYGIKTLNLPLGVAVSSYAVELVKVQSTKSSFKIQSLSDNCSTIFITCILSADPSDLCQTFNSIIPWACNSDQGGYTKIVLTCRNYDISAMALVNTFGFTPMLKKTYRNRRTNNILQWYMLDLDVAFEFHFKMKKFWENKCL